MDKAEDRGVEGSNHATVPPECSTTSRPTSKTELMTIFSTLVGVKLSRVESSPVRHFVITPSYPRRPITEFTCS